jgi:hypothetical protein
MKKFIHKFFVYIAIVYTKKNIFKFDSLKEAPQKFSAYFLPLKVFANRINSHFSKAAKDPHLTSAVALKK